jgi:hypothetical protein
MESLLEDSARLAQPHALPFRIIFDEYLRRDQVKLLTGADIVSQQAVSQALTLQNMADQ